jgi:uncharacterized protein
MLRLSNYSIFVDLPGDETLLVHGYSGAWDIVPADLAKQIRLFRNGPAFKPLYGKGFSDEPPEEKPTPSEPRLRKDVRALMIKRGYLTELTAEEERARVASLAAQLHDMASHEAPSYVFALTYECNLRCGYCFQDSLRARPENAPLLVPMSMAMVDRIFAAMPEIEARHSRPGSPQGTPPQRRFTLFGGEPLLHRFRPLVEYVVGRARAEGPASIAAITNGTQLEHFTDLIGPAGISFLQITLDGAPSQHDRRRIGPEGGPTFDAIARNIDLALSLEAEVKVRVNVDRGNVDTLPLLAEVMRDRGWFESPRFSAYATPVHESLGSGSEACGFGSWDLSRRLLALAREHPLVAAISGPDKPWERRIREVLRGSRDPLLSLQPSFCGAHTQTWVFDAHGDIYACWERAGYVKDRIGRLSPEGGLVMDAPVETTWRGRTIASNPVCGQCPYAFYCGGGCALLAELQNGQLHSNHCDDFSRRFKALAAQEVRALQVEALARAASAARLTS